VAILPYYVVNLNIEATFAAISGQYSEFPNLCFVDTLDNVAGLGKFSGYQEDMFGAVSEENVARIKRQNKRMLARVASVVGKKPEMSSTIRSGSVSQSTSVFESPNCKDAAFTTNRCAIMRKATRSATFLRRSACRSVSSS